MDFIATEGIWLIFIIYHVAMEIQNSSTKNQIKFPLTILTMFGFFMFYRYNRCRWINIAFWFDCTYDMKWTLYTLYNQYDTKVMWLTGENQTAICISLKSQSKQNIFDNKLNVDWLNTTNMCRSIWNFCGVNGPHVACARVHQRSTTLTSHMNFISHR